MFDWCMSKIMQAPSDGRAFTDYQAFSAKHGAIKTLLNTPDERSFRLTLQRYTPKQFNRLLLQQQRAQGR